MFRTEDVSEEYAAEFVALYQESMTRSLLSTPPKPKPAPESSCVHVPLYSFPEKCDSFASRNAIAKPRLLGVLQQAIVANEELRAQAVFIRGFNRKYSLKHWEEAQVMYPSIHDILVLFYIEAPHVIW